MEENELCMEMAFYMIMEKATIRKTAKEFKVAKSTVYKYLTKQLKKIDVCLAIEVRRVLNYNKAERARRGGLATRKKRRKTKSGK